jgi:hypothetical protein
VQHTYPFALNRPLVGSFQLCSQLLSKVLLDNWGPVTNGFSLEGLELFWDMRARGSCAQVCPGALWSVPCFLFSLESSVRES